MSSLLEQAIIDAKMLKETARKNAEAALLEQYSEEIKNNIQSLLEQDEVPAPEIAEPTPEPVSPSVKKVMDTIPPAYLNEDGMQEIEIDLNSLVEKVTKLEEEIGEGKLPSAEMQVEAGGYEDVGVNEEDKLEESDKSEMSANEKQVAAKERESAAKHDAKAAALDAQDKKEEKEKKLEEEYALDEELMMDIDNERTSGLEYNEIEEKRQQDISDAVQSQLDEKDMELEQALKYKQELEEALVETNNKVTELKNKLKNSIDLNVQLKEGIEYLSNKINETNILNARLLYTNKTLGNISLNERQKTQIAESISHASSVEEAKTIYETLQKSTSVLTEKRNAPQSLTEALNKGPSPFLSRSNKPQVDPTKDRWKILAGIKK